jgi:hypothetical protein
MVFILLSEFGSVLRAWIPNGEQKRLRVQKGELLPFLTIFGTAMRAKPERTKERCKFLCVEL